MLEVVKTPLDKASRFVSIRPPFVPQRIACRHLETQPMVWGLDSITSHSALYKERGNFFFTDYDHERLEACENHLFK